MIDSVLRMRLKDSFCCSTKIVFLMGLWIVVQLLEAAEIAERRFQRDVQEMAFMHLVFPIVVNFKGLPFQLGDIVEVKFIELAIDELPKLNLFSILYVSFLYLLRLYPGNAHGGIYLPAHFSLVST